MSAGGQANAVVHGGRLGAARRLFPGAPEPFLDLSTGINPHAYPLPDLPPDAWSRLPEPEQEAALVQAAAHAYGVADPACVVAAPGTQSLIGLLPLLFPARQVAVLGPTYGEHALAWRRAGAEVREVTEPDGMRAADLRVLVQPNNPDGRVLSRAALRDLVPRHGLLVIDEAFADLEDAASLGGELPHDNVLLLRSFGKTYGLAGLRLGFALAAPELVARIGATLGPWAVSGPALAIGIAALRDDAWRAAMRRRLAADAARLDALLARAGFALLGGTRLFRLAAHPEASSFWQRLGQAGILVRRFPADPAWLRFGLPGDAASWARLEAALWD